MTTARSHSKSSLTLTKPERRAWEQVLGWSHSKLSAWGRNVDWHLQMVPPDRRVAHLAHALRVFPFVSATPEDRFSFVPFTTEQWDRLAARDGEVLDHLAREVKEDAVSIEDAAERIASCSSMQSDDADDRAFAIARLFRSNRVVPLFVGHECLAPVSNASDDARVHEVLVKHRDVLLELLRAAVTQFRCSTDQHLAPQAQALLRGVERIGDPDERAIVFGYVLVGMFGEACRPLMQQINAQAHLLEAVATGRAKIVDPTELRDPSGAEQDPSAGDEPQMQGLFGAMGAIPKG